MEKSMKIMKTFLSSLFFITLSPVVSSATTWDNAYIKAFVQKSLESELSPPLGGKISFDVTDIDPRIIIKPCQVPIKANIPENTDRRNINVKLICEDSTPWYLYIPTKIERTFAVVVTTSTIEKGEILTTENIAIDYVAKNRIRGERLTDINAVLGSKAEKRIGVDNAITSNSICLVCKGDTITIIAKNDNFVIKTKGTALSSGNLNEQISVKNTRSGRVIQPKIITVNEVIINL
jgi:flagella basal body P-ring formation protein FlgA